MSLYLLPEYMWYTILRILRESVQGGLMKDPSGTNPDLVEEISALRKRIQELERSEAELKKAEEELVVSKDRLSRAELVSRCGNWEFDLASKKVFASEGARSIYGLLDREWTIEEVQEIPLPEYRGMLDEALRGLIDENRPYRVEFKIGRPDTGAIVDIYSIGEYDSCRNVVFGIVQDITERKRTEEALRQVEARYRLPFERAPYGIVIIDPVTTRFVEFNETAHRQLGYSREEFAALSIADIQAVESPEETRKHIENVIRLGRDDFETLHRTREGETRNVHVTAQMTEISGYSLYHSVWSDITDRKRAEKALRESEERFRGIANNLPGTLFQWYARDNGERGMYYVDVRSADVWGVGVDPIENWPERFDACIAPEDKERWVLSVEEVARTGNPWDIEARFIKPTGEEMYVKGLAQPKRLGNELVSNGLLLDITARKRAELSLLESEFEYRTVVEHSLGGVYIFQDGLFRFVNTRFGEILGYACEEIIDTLGPLDIAHPAERPVIDELIRQLLCGEAEEVCFTHKAFRKDGTPITVMVFGGPLTYRGRPACSGTMYDITEREKAEVQLRQKTALLEAQLNTSLDGILVVDRGIKILQNEQFNKLFKIPDHIVENEVDAPQVEWVSGLAKNPEQFSEKVAYMFAHPGETMHDECELKDGTVLERYSSPIIGKDGTDYGRIWTFRDITERKLMEEEIAGERSKLKILSDNAPFGLVLIEKDGSYTYVNPKFRELFGFDRSGDRTWLRDAFPKAEYRRAVKSAWIEDMADAKPGAGKSRVFTVTCKGGDEKVVSFIASKLVSGDYMLACEDITELRQLESKLRQAQKMEAVGTLAGGVAHDFNNILTVIMGYSALLQMEMEQDSPLRSYVGYIRSSAEKAADLTRSLLSFSRQQPIVLSHIDLNESVRSAEKLLNRLLTENIVIKTLLSAEDITIIADGTQIDQILLNLAANARDAMPEGGTLTVVTKAVELDEEFTRVHGYGEPGKFALLSVSDTGTGMDEATRERIFDPFFTTKETGKGTGLGLSSVYGIVKQHRGYIAVYSEPDRGTTFHIYLPQVSEAAQEKRQASVPIDGGDETILIAEDNKAVRDLICRILTDYGYVTIEAVDGEDAIERFRKADRIDLLILDSVMPKKSGREVYNEIHEIEPDIKVIFTSGYTRDVILDKGIEDKEFEFVSKPLSPTTLLQKVRAVLDQQVFK